MPSRASQAAADEVVELEHWDAADGTSEEDDFDDELPAEAEARVEPDGDGYGEPQEQLPQPDKGSSMPDLPKVRSSAFKRILK